MSASKVQPMRYSMVFAEARRLYKLGFAIQWLYPKSKVPIGTGWASGPRKDWALLEAEFTAGYNLSVRLGTPSKVGQGYLTVIDVDVKSSDPKHLKEAMEALAPIVGEITFPIVESGRGGGSRHYYCVTEKPFKTFNAAWSKEKIKVHMPSKDVTKVERKELTEDEILSGLRISRAWEISFYNEGRHVVLPPSVHSDTGQLYQWSLPLDDVDDLPLYPLEKLRPGLFDEAGAVGPAAAKPGVAGEAVVLGDFKVEPVELGWLPISDEVRDAIVTGKGVDDRSAYLLRASSALISAGLTQNEVLTVLTDPTLFLGQTGYGHAKTKDRARAAQWIYGYTVGKVVQERSGAGVFASLPLPAVKASAADQEATAAEFAEAHNFRQDLDRDNRFRPISTLKNMDLIFTHHLPDNPFVQDLFASRIMYGANTPWGGEKGRYIEDIDMILVKRWLASTEFGIEPPTGAVLEATALIAHRKRIHPVREYLDSLVWDGVPRIDTWIRDFCQGKAEEPYLSEAGRKFLLALVKRVFEPGCQWDYVLVLEGNQGKYKSSAARALAGDKWFMDNLPDLKDKDSMLNLQGKWLIELGELASVKRADFNQVKAYLVRRHDTVRPHYGRLVADVPRQSVFIGTVNEGQYLKDPTGNRRYWPVKVGLCDVKALTAMRDQLFAEAMEVYRSTNEVLMMSPEAEAQAREAQEGRRIDDEETEMREAMEEFMQTEIGKNFDFSSFLIRDLTTGVNAPLGRWASDRYFRQTAASALRNLGFDRKKVRGQRVWWHPEKDVEKMVENEGAYPTRPMPPGYAPMPPKNDEMDFR